VTNLLEVGAARWRRPFACKLHDADFKGEFKLGDGGVFLWLERLASCLSCLDGSCKPAGLGSPVVVTPHQSAAAGFSFGSRRESMKFKPPSYRRRTPSQ